MKITLVNPPYPPSAHSHPPFIPLGIAYLGAVAEKAGHEVTVIDCQAEKLTVEEFRGRIEGVPSNVVGVTSTTLLYNSAKGILVAAKQAYPNAVTMMGGSRSRGLGWGAFSIALHPDTSEIPPLNELWQEWQARHG